MAVERNISEAARERETFQYDSHLIARAIPSKISSLLPPSSLHTSPDSALTAFAALCASRLDVSRSLISLFDHNSQYIVAEGTPRLPLSPYVAADELDGETLWLCGTAIPRAQGICEHVLSTCISSSREPQDLPLLIVPNLDTDTRFTAQTSCPGWLKFKFYAGVPLRSVSGIDIGVLCVFDDQSREGLSSRSIRVMQDLSVTIVSYLEAKRSRDGYCSGERMVRGLGSFVEGQSTMANWSSSHNLDAFRDNVTQEGALNHQQQDIQSKKEADGVIAATATARAAAKKDIHIRSLQNLVVSPSTRGTTTTPLADGADDHEVPTSPVEGGPTFQSPVLSAVSGSHSPAPATRAIEHIFSRAANVIRESIEVESALFLDASIGAFGGLATSSYTHNDAASRGSSPSRSGGELSDATADAGSAEDGEVGCHVLGFSTSLRSSIDGSSKYNSHSTILPQKLLAKLLRRYPRGKIFNFDSQGSRQSSEGSGVDGVLFKAQAETDRRSRSAPTSPGTPAKRGGRFSRRNEGRILLGMFPGARSVAMFPLWDSEKQRWYAAGFVCTRTPTRLFTPGGELSYLLAFSAVAMGEVYRVKQHFVSLAKNDLLSSLSHELRSPLHGVILGAELLNDTSLDAFQGDVLHSIETCGRTLLETINHLLDYSKINNFRTVSPRRPSVTRGISEMSMKERPQAKGPSIEAGMMSITSIIELDTLVEEVFESVYAGYTFQQRSTGNNSQDAQDAHANRRQDAMQAEEGPFPMGEVVTSLDIERGDWRFFTQPGAIRRIIMNLLGNALKYTSKGFVKLSLSQEPPSVTGSRGVRIVVSDSGCGIGEDYLRNEIFTAFTQEDRLSAGAGLGLSLVKKVTASLKGSIQIWSKPGHGTACLVRLPLQEVPTEDDPIDGPGDFPSENKPSSLESQSQELRGLRVLLLGYSAEADTRHQRQLPEAVLHEQRSIKAICEEWLGMTVVLSFAPDELRPDLILCAQDAFESLKADSLSRNEAPTIVLCRNAFQSRQLSMTEGVNNKSVIEFIAQPLGPRKLCKIMVLTFRRWMTTQLDRYPPANDSFSDDSGPVSEGYTPATEDHDELGQGSETPARSDGPEIERSSSSPSIRSDNTAKGGEPSDDVMAKRSPARATAPAFLLVDDNTINLKILGSFMQRLGLAYATAMDGQQAVDAVRASPGQFRCIFMDISMPVMDGFQASRHIRMIEAEEQAERCSIFALTGLASSDAQQEAFASGIDLFLTKPVKLKELDHLLTTRNML